MALRRIEDCPLLTKFSSRLLDRFARHDDYRYNINKFPNREPAKQQNVNVTDNLHLLTAHQHQGKKLKERGLNESASPSKLHLSQVHSRSRILQAEDAGRDVLHVQLLRRRPRLLK